VALQLVVQHWEPSRPVLGGVRLQYHKLRRGLCSSLAVAASGRGCCDCATLGRMRRPPRSCP
jgi:hypothetical protein